MSFAVIWIGVNLPYASQLVQATRDPGLYTVLGIWLSQHTSPAIDVSTALHYASGISHLTANLGAFAASPDGAVHIQGGALLPAFLGVGGWLFGIKGVLVTNIVLGGGAMVAVYGLARTLLGPVLALVPQVALGLSVALVYLSRAPYSETIMLAVCAAGLTWLIAAIREQRFALYVVSGVFLGSSGFARIDAGIAIIGIAVSLGVAVFLVRATDKAKALVKGSLLLFGAALTTLAVSVLGMYLNENSYLNDLLSQTTLLWAATLAVTFIACCTFIVRLKWEVTGQLSDVALRRVGVVFASLVAIVYLFWLSRPLWYVAHFSSGAVAVVTEQMQKSEGLPLDGTRSYDEQTLAWVGWYFGWPVVILAGIGLVILVYKSFATRNLKLLMLACATLAAAGLYITKVSITPDQAWAYRRLLPIITPGLLIAAAYPLWLVARRGRVAQWISGALAVAVALTPIVTWNGLLRVADGAGEYKFATSICSGLTGRTVFMATDGGPAYYALTLKTVCDVNVISGTAVTTADMVKLKKRVPDIEVVILAPNSMPGTSHLPNPNGTQQIVRWESALTHLPKSLVGSEQQFWYGTLSDTGKFVPRN